MFCNYVLYEVVVVVVVVAAVIVVVVIVVVIIVVVIVVVVVVNSSSSSTTTSVPMCYIPGVSGAIYKVRQPGHCDDTVQSWDVCQGQLPVDKVCG